MHTFNPPETGLLGVMRVSVGVDLVEVARIARLVARPAGLARLLTEREMSYCRTRRHPAEHVAVRFAAKEAVVKAFGTGISNGIRWTEIEILNECSGRPRVELHGRAAEFAKNKGIRAVEITLSHTSGLGIAYAIATWVEEGRAGASLPTLAASS